MQKLVVVIGLVSLLGLGFSFYTHMMSDEMRLERLGYSKEVIHQLMEEKNDVVEKLIEDKINSDEILIIYLLKISIMIAMKNMLIFKNSILI